MDLSPFVPRLVPEWIAEAPEARHRSIDGTLVFTDLSGFTAMSERLAELGKVGAEELTQHLDATFTELVAVSGGLGGTMLKFGGDALLIFFWGEQHELRGARAAVEMHATLGRVGRIETSAGEIRLQMTVGLHCGTVDFFLVGASHRELFVCGETASTTVDVEGQASSGEIRLSPEITGRLPADVVDTAASPALLTHAPDVETTFTAWPKWPVGTSARLFVPEMLRNHLVSGIELREHKQMSVGFVHLSNVDQLITDVGPDVTAQHLTDLVAHLQSVLATHGVAFISTDVYEGGPKVICAAGAVRTFGNDDESLLRALREIADYPSPVELRVGIHRGHGFCGYVGPTFRRTFVTIGDVVNTAARVMSKAGPAEILSTAAPLERSDTTFEIEALAPFAAKGKAEPLRAFRVGRVSGTRTRDAGPRLRLVGRDAELALLTKAAEDSKAGTGRFIEIRGDTGIGKTRLLEEIVGLSGMRTVEARCGRYAVSTPYFPFRTLASDLAGSLPGDSLNHRVRTRAPHLAPYVSLFALLLGQIPTPTPEIERLSAKDQRTKLHEVVAEVLRSLVSEPLTWIVEDAHWIDPASADLVRYLAANAASLPTLLCVTRRAEEDEPLGSADQVIDLSPLTDDAANELLKAAAKAHLLPREVARLTERSHGNPYFLIELADVASSQRDLDHLPDSLEALVAAKVDALPPADRLVLRQLAVVGSRFDPVVAEESVPGLREISEERWSRLDTFVDRSDLPWRFRQALIRDTAYEGLSYKERRDVHARAGEVIERHAVDVSMVCELLSLHFHAAGAHEKSLRFSNEAGEKAKQSFALAESSTFFGRSVEAARGLEKRVELGDALTQLAHAELSQGRYAQARDGYDESLGIKRELGDEQGIAAQLSGLGVVSRQLGEYERARDLFEQSLSILETLDDPRNVGSVLRNVGTISWLQGDYAEAKRWFERSVEVFTKDGDTSGIASSLDTLGTVSFVTGDLKAAQERYEEGVAILRRQGDKQGLAAALNNLGNVAFQQGDLATASRHYAESLDTRRELGDRPGVSTVLGNLGTVAYFEKDYERARSHYEEALGIAREIGDIRGTSLCLHNLSEIAIVDGDFPAARLLCEEALGLRRDVGDPRGTAESLTTLGTIASAMGDHADAHAYLLEALGLLHELGNNPGLAECLEAVALTADELGDAMRAATLLGAVDAILESAESARTWSSERRTTLDASLRDQLGESVVHMTMELGGAMSAERVIDLARGLLGHEIPAEAPEAS
ncbi:MAG: tetratricopeptide repeat protein [Actinomycetota bacterium]